MQEARNRLLSWHEKHFQLSRFDFFAVEQLLNKSMQK